MTQLNEIRSIAPEALAVAGVLDPPVAAGAGSRGYNDFVDPGDLPDSAQPWQWHWSPDLLSRLAEDSWLQVKLGYSWFEAAGSAAGPVRLTLYGVPHRSRHALATRLAEARPAVGAVFIADDTLEPEPRWQWPLRLCAVTTEAAEGLFAVLDHDAEVAPVIDVYTLGEQDGDCDVLAVSGAAEFDALTVGGGLSAVCLAWCAPQPPDPHQLAQLDAAARRLDASGWVVADLSATGAVDWLDRFVRHLSENLALDEAAGRAGSWLTVAHPGLAEHHAVAEGLAAAVEPPPAPAVPPPPVEPAELPAGGSAEPYAGGLGGQAADDLRLSDRRPPLAALTDRIRRAAAGVRFNGIRLGGVVADAVREVRQAGAAPGVTNDRYLQALVSDQQTGNRLLHAFHAGAVNEIHLRVGPHSAEWHQMASAFPEQGLEFRGGAARLTVTFDEERDQALLHEPVEVFLPRRGASSEAVFPVTVGAQEREIRCTARVYYRKRQLQRLVISGPVAASDDPVDGREIAINGEAYDSLAEPPSRHDDTDTDASAGAGAGDAADSAATDARSATIRIVSDEVLVVGTGENGPVRIPDLDRFRAGIRGLLNQSVNEDAAATGPATGPGPGPGSPTPVALLRGLAQQGSSLYQQLEQQGCSGLKDAASLQLVSAETAELWPLEFVYDYGYPADTAKLCDGWQHALETGTCSCRRPDRSGVLSRRTICPLGFWGLRMVIERRVERAQLDRSVVEQAPQGTRSTLRPVDGALFAASRIVRKADRDHAVGTLLDSFGPDALHTADSWKRWRQVVKTEGPPLLLAVPHHGHDQGATPVLEIGRASKLPSLLIDRRDIVSDLHSHEVGPVVMLLGCNTAQEDVSWQNVAARFLEKSAPVVVGTLVPTLGRQAAVMAGIAGVMLAGNTREDLTIGELVRDIRRQLLLRGCTLAMAVVAFGDARWLVGNRPPVTDDGPAAVGGGGGGGGVGGGGTPEAAPQGAPGGGS
ncbi:MULTISPECIES: hypothetical protein [unclassified Kitasatospora]|uniref:hypothetical protein n=1 Tax=unclassified Kitasatospora TaxID=2633591 RepID=UPI0033FC0DFC